MKAPNLLQDWEPGGILNAMLNGSCILRKDTEISPSINL